MNIPTSPGCWILLTLYSGNAFLFIIHFFIDFVQHFCHFS